MNSFQLSISAFEILFRLHFVKFLSPPPIDTGSMVAGLGLRVDFGRFTAGGENSRNFSDGRKPFRFSFSWRCIWG